MGVSVINPDELAKILADLPTIRRIALRPWEMNPLLSVVLAQAQALQEIAAWAAKAQELSKQAEEAPSSESDSHA